MNMTYTQLTNQLQIMLLFKKPVNPQKVEFVPIISAIHRLLASEDTMLSRLGKNRDTQVT